jgi:hypothetical protein
MYDYPDLNGGLVVVLAVVFAVVAVVLDPATSANVGFLTDWVGATD